MTIRRMLPVLVATIPLAACASHVPASRAGGVLAALRAIEALEQEYQQAVAVGDRTRQEQLLAEDYMFVTPFGQVLDRQATLNDPQLFEFVSSVDDLRLRVSESGDTVVVTMKARSVHITTKAVREVRTVRVWSLRQGAWRAIVGQQSSLPGTPPNSGGH